MDAVWPDTTVDETNLNQAISTLRRALGESAGEPRFIATVPRRGYQLIVPVAVANGEAEASETAPVASADGAGARGDALAVGVLSRWRSLSSAQRMAAFTGAVLGVVLVAAFASTVAGPNAAQPAPSIAVLPFQDMSPAGDQGYFADGVAEEILDELTRFDDLRVAGMLSASAAAEAGSEPRAIGRALGVANVLTGGVRVEGDRLRVSAQLVSTADGFQLWSETYDRRLDDVFAIQDEIAASVVEALSVTLGVPAPAPRYGAESVEAYDHYLRGRAYWAQSGTPALLAAIDEFRLATDIDPDFGAAWASMARAADALRVLDPANEAGHRALQEEATQRARDADPDRWEAVALRARLLMSDLDWTAAAAVLDEAGRRAPPTPVEEAEIEGVFLLQVGRVADAGRIFEAAQASDPLSFNAAASLAWALDLAGELEDALAVYDQAQTLPHDAAAWAFPQLLRVMRTGDPDAVDAAFAAYPYQEDGVGELLMRLSRVWRTPEAALNEIWAAVAAGSVWGPYRIDALGLLAAHYGDADLAIALFREEYFERGGSSTALLWHPMMAEARRGDGFKTLVRDLGLVDHWRESGVWADACRPLDSQDFECF
jgi:TolB-like protein/thioredoxin-like negative regulator of GroEL